MRNERPTRYGLTDTVLGEQSEPERLRGSVVFEAARYIATAHYVRRPARC